MPGFVINDIGGNPHKKGVGPESRFYTSYSWEIDIIDLNTKLSTVGSGDAFNGILLRTASLPQPTFTKVKAEGGTIDYQFAGKPIFDDVRLSFYDSTRTTEIYKEWLKQIFTVSDGIKPPDSYKAKSVIRKYLADRTDETDGKVQKYTLYGSWPVSFKESELTYLEASIKSIEIVLTYDYFEIEEEK